MSAVLVIGCGSIGSRRARLLAEMGHEVGLYDKDSRASRLVADAIGVRAARGPTHWMVAELEHPDAVFICTPADTHVELAMDLVEYGACARGIFIEKPLSTSMDGVAELVEECERRGVVTMGACNMRWAYPDAEGPYWHKEAVFCVAKPLSGWRAGASEAYRGNGVIMEAAIHEIDLAQWLCGPIVGCEAEGDDDSAHIVLRHARGGCSDVYASWAEAAPSRRYLVTSKRQEPDTSDEMYRKEMAHFLRAASGEELPTNPLRQAAETLRWALHARDLTRRVAA